MAFSWIPFLRSHGVAFIESGPNVGKGNINVHCPMCGSADSSFHLGISLEGRGWGCWRSATHRGKSRAKLIAALLGCSLDEAFRLAGGKPEAELGREEDFGAAIAAVLGMAAEPTDTAAAGRLELLPEMLPVRGSRGEPYLNYLTSPEREYTRSEAEELVELYGLTCARSGPFTNRLVIPIEMPSQGLVNWTGRALGKNTVPRYKTLSTREAKGQEEGLPLAKRTITDCLWNYPQLLHSKHDMLVVCEGPFDAIRLDYFGELFGIRATCLFGKNMSKEQAYLLGELSDNYRKKVLLLDKDASLDAFALNDAVAHFGFLVHTIDDQKDPALFSPKRIRELKSLS